MHVHMYVTGKIFSNNEKLTTSSRATRAIDEIFSQYKERGIGKLPPSSSQCDENNDVLR